MASSSLQQQVAIIQILHMVEPCLVCGALVHCDGRGWDKLEIGKDRVGAVDHGTPTEISLHCRTAGNVPEDCLISKFYRL